MSRLISFLHLKKSKNDNVFNINVRRSILVHNNDIKYFDKRSFLNKENKSRRLN